jgi:hypothetical protein
LNDLRQQLGDELFAAMWQEGQTTSLTQIAAAATTLSLA